MRASNWRLCPGANAGRSGARGASTKRELAPLWTPRLLVGILLLALAACAHAPSSAPAGREPIAEGMASFYGESFRGRLTANGEKFDPDALTAAHRTLPFGTCLHVENVANGRSVRVRVNDRGPYAKGRILDLSEAAARALDLVRQGVARVRLFACS